MALTDTKIRNAKPKSKPYKLHDRDGLFALVHTNGSRYWRFKYRFLGKEKLLALGVYPEVNLSEARERRAQARKILAEGNDPVQIKQESKRIALLNSENTFEAVSREWIEQRRDNWTPNYADAMLRRLKQHVFPKLGDRPIKDISPPELLSALRVIEKTGALDLAQRLLQAAGQIFMYAIATGRAERNPVPDLRGALKSPVRKNMAYLKQEELPEYLQKLEAYNGDAQTKLALKFLLLTFVRTSELRASEWQEINFDKAEWRIPAKRMKMRDPHIVPLSRQAMDILKELQKHSGNRKYIFPNQHKPLAFMSENTMLYALYRMGYHSRATGHGFRSTASTILNEHGYAPDVIERQLAHSERNTVRAAYNHAQYLPERRKMMQEWADHLDELQKQKKQILGPFY